MAGISPTLKNEVLHVEQKLETILDELRSLRGRIVALEITTRHLRPKRAPEKPPAR